MCFVATFLTPTAFSQIPTGTINGRVTDAKNAVLSGVQVSAVSGAQGASYSTVSNSSGLYVLPNLPAGAYELTFRAHDFAAREVKGIVIEAGRDTTADGALDVAGSQTTVEVDATTATVDQTQSMIQGEITSKTIESIPLNGRNFLELAYLIPGNRPAPTFDPDQDQHA